MNKEIKTLLRILILLLILAGVIIIIDTLIYFTYFTNTQTEGDCGEYQEYHRQSIIKNLGNCVNKKPSIIKDCLNYDGDICIEWTKRYSLK